MIVLDTNVISELMRREPDPRVMAWIAEQPMAGVFTTTLTQAEIAAIVAIARKHNIYVFCDEVYKGVELDGIPRPWLADCYEKASPWG